MPVGSNAKFGYASSVGVSEETTYGTKVDSFKYVEFNSESMKREIEEKKLESINGTRDFIKRLLGNETVSGSLDVHLNPAEDSILRIVKHAMGGTVSSAKITTTADDMFLHTFAVGDMELNDSSVSSAAVKGLSLQIDEGGIVWDFLGCRVNQLSIKGEVGSPIMMSAEFIGKTASITTSTPTVVFSNILPCNFNGVTFQTGDSLTNLTTTVVQSFEFSINNNLAADAGRELGSRVIGILPPVRREVKLKVGMRFDTTTSHNVFLAATVTAIRITLDSSQTITSASVTSNQTYNMIINLPRCYYNSNMPEVGGPDVLTHELDISALSQNTTTAYAVQITAQNATSGY